MSLPSPLPNWNNTSEVTFRGALALPWVPATEIDAQALAGLHDWRSTHVCHGVGWVATWQQKPSPTDFPGATEVIVVEFDFLEEGDAGGGAVFFTVEQQTI